MVRNAQGQMSQARSRLLGTASRLFYAEGLHSVGVDRIVAEAGTTRATLYRHFPSKDDLIVSYLEEADQAVRDRLDHTRAGGRSAADTLRAIASDIAGDIRTPGFRGCAFLNAAAEYSDPAHPVHRRIVAHRQWFLSALTDLFARISDARADSAGRHFVMLRDGAMAAGCLSDPAPVCRTLVDGVDGLVRFHAVPDAERPPRAEAEVG
jgi:AcrR family transcriptional regulator